jgi:hypothetical protein
LFGADLTDLRSQKCGCYAARHYKITRVISLKNRRIELLMGA